MGMPALLTANATGTTGLVWMPDWMQTPFQVGIVGSAVGGAASQYAVEYTPNDINTQGLGTSLANAVWVPVTGLSAATTVTIGSSFEIACRAFRLNLASATATTLVTVYFTQATFPR